MAGQGGIHTAQAVASPRELREVYAKPFQAAITDGKLDSVMNSYAAIDGQVPAGSSWIQISEFSECHESIGQDAWYVLLWRL